MKELSIIEKADAYDRVAKEVKDFFEGKQKMYNDVTKTLENLFPELKEPEDERIRKQLLNWFKGCHWDSIDDGRLKRDDIIAWLESLKDRFSPMNRSIESDNVAKPNINVSDLV